MMRDYCDAAGRRSGCSNPVAFVARHNTAGTEEYVCGEHLVAALEKHDDGAWTVAVVKRGGGGRLTPEQQRSVGQLFEKRPEGAR